MKKACYLANYSCRIACLLLVATSTVSCLKDKMQFPAIVEDVVSYSQEYNNYSDVKINIQTAYPGMTYSVYFDEPYDSLGSLSTAPFLVAQTPIDLSLRVPNDVDTLYILGAGGVVTKEAKKDIKNGVVSINTRAKFATRSNEALDSDLLAEIYSILDNKFFPEQPYNFRGEELYKCSDLKVEQLPSTGDFDEAEVWITYLGDGGFSMNARLWFYTYPSDKLESLTYKDCTFYGIDDKYNVIEITPESFYMKEDGVTYIKDKNETFKKSTSLFHNKLENARIANTNEYKKLYLGKFPKGVNIGFVFRGADERCQFTTPVLNLSIKGTDYDYIEKNITLDKVTPSIQFTPTKPVANGFICSIIEGDRINVKVLGMDNRCVSNKYYDGDYNDMLCLIETSPIYLPTVEIPNSNAVEEYVVEKGVYLFEDNYPTVGDYDFNDVVVEYEIKKFVNSSALKGREIKSRLLAYGCSFPNEFGYRIGDSDFKFEPVFTNISGYKNVGEGYSEEGLRENTLTDLPAEGDIRPYLYNGTSHVVDANYNTGAYPYVLIIPSTGNVSKEFRWCIEGKSINDAYNFAAPRVNDWYLTPKDANLVIKRSETK